MSIHAAPPHWRIDLMVGFSVCKEQEMAAEEISWPTLADIQPTSNRHPADMRFANLQT
jgi:hypothetical protein